MAFMGIKLVIARRDRFLELSMLWLSAKLNTILTVANQSSIIFNYRMTLAARAHLEVFSKHLAVSDNFNSMSQMVVSLECMGPIPI